MNTIALCIPAYNAAKYLPRLLNSAKNQVIPFDEIYVYNDYSQDNTAEIAMDYGAIVINGKINKGCSIGKNKLASVVKSDWIHFHDADDELLPNFTCLAHKWIHKNDVSEVVLFDYEYRDHETGELLSIRKFDRLALENDPISYAINEQINPFCGLYHKKSFLKAGGYDTDPAVLYNEDTAFHISLALFGLKFSSESEISIINYRIGNSMSQNSKEKCFIAQYHVMKKTADRADRKYEPEMAKKFWEIAVNLATLNKWDLVKSCLYFAKKFGLNYQPVNRNIIFNLIAKLYPFGAIWTREKMIQLTKPQLRN